MTTVANTDGQQLYSLAGDIITFISGACCMPHHVDDGAVIKMRTCRACQQKTCAAENEEYSDLEGIIEKVRNDEVADIEKILAGKRILSFVLGRCCQEKVFSTAETTFFHFCSNCRARTLAAKHGGPSVVALEQWKLGSDDFSRHTDLTSFVVGQCCQQHFEVQTDYIRVPRCETCRTRTMAAKWETSVDARAVTKVAEKKKVEEKAEADKNAGFMHLASGGQLQTFILGSCCQSRVVTDDAYDYLRFCDVCQYRTMVAKFGENL